MPPGSEAMSGIAQWPKFRYTGEAEKAYSRRLKYENQYRVYCQLELFPDIVNNSGHSLILSFLSAMKKRRLRNVNALR